MCRYAEFAHYYRGAETLNKFSPRNRELDFQSSGSGTIDAIGNEKNQKARVLMGAYGVNTVMMKKHGDRDLESGRRVWFDRG